MDAAKKLLQYGLKGTDLEALVAIGKGEDGGRFGKSIWFCFCFLFKEGCMKSFLIICFVFQIYLTGGGGH